jgi:nitroimidazol reductase NimA-like FMN-containing flavoprotein (pyridoxamine 5'-phosphate oxidase superfamily)
MQHELSPTLLAFCQHAELLRLAYLDRQGFPRVVPVWFVIIDRAYYIGTGATMAKWRAMQRDARIGWVIDGGSRSGYKGASLRGRAAEVRDATMRARIYEALGKKYFDTPEDAKFIDIFGRVDDPATVYLQLIPEDGLMWEY